MSGILGYLLNNFSYPYFRKSIESIDTAFLTKAILEGYVLFSISRRIYKKTLGEVWFWMLCGAGLTAVASRKRAFEWINVLTLYPEDKIDYRLMVVPITMVGVDYLFKRRPLGVVMAPLVGLAAGGLVARYLRVIPKEQLIFSPTLPRRGHPSYNGRTSEEYEVF